MENKKIDVLFGVVVIAFLVVTFILIKDFNSRRANDYKEYKAYIVNIVRMKDDKIKILSNLLTAKERENMDLRNTLADTRNSLDTLSKKLAPPTPTAVAASAPAAAAAAK